MDRTLDLRLETCVHCAQCRRFGNVVKEIIKINRKVPSLRLKYLTLEGRRQRFINTTRVYRWIDSALTSCPSRPRVRLLEMVTY
jgi:hypothetical protein